MQLWTIRRRRTGVLAVENAMRFPPRTPLPTSSTASSFIMVTNTSRINIQGRFSWRVRPTLHPSLFTLHRLSHIPHLHRLQLGPDLGSAGELAAAIVDQLGGLLHQLEIRSL